MQGSADHASGSPSIASQVIFDLRTTPPTVARVGAGFLKGGAKGRPNSASSHEVPIDQRLGVVPHIDPTRHELTNNSTIARPFLLGMVSGSESKSQPTASTSKNEKEGGLNKYQCKVDFEARKTWEEAAPVLAQDTPQGIGNQPLAPPSGQGPSQNTPPARKFICKNKASVPSHDAPRGDGSQPLLPPSKQGPAQHAPRIRKGTCMGEAPTPAHDGCLNKNQLMAKLETREMHLRRLMAPPGGMEAIPWPPGANKD